jgi:hypothetical protein
VNDIAIKSNFATIGDHGTDNRFDQRRFTGTIITDQAKDFSRVQVKIRAIQRNNATIALDQATCL